MAHFGVAFFPTDYSIQPIPLAKALEERSLDSLYVTEHTHIPASRKTPWPGGADLPQEYWHTHDPFVALAAAAAVTERLRLGTGICLVVERDPIQLAKEIASLDIISGGRVILGVGAGWNREEMENHGARFDKRWAIVREKVLAMKAIWTEDEAEYHGSYVNFDSIWSWPKPFQKPNPPILLGGESVHTLRRVVDYCDGWLPRARDPDMVLRGMGILGKLSKEAGREIPTSVFAPAPKWLDKFADAGVTRCILMVPAAGTEATLKRLDQYTKYLS